MPLLLDTARSGSPLELRGTNCLTIGLVNNMPDSAFEATERQFVELVRAAAADVVVRLKLFAIAEVPRADHVRGQLADRCRDISELWDTHLDGLIVTGTEPRAARLQDEPYWPTLAKLVAWARDNTASTIWSCLAAHAAVLHADGIERRLLREKRFGVFDCDVVADHGLMTGMPPRFFMPHSRHNDLSAADLVGGGYRLLTTSAAAGVDAFVKEQTGLSLFLFFQGHPEYEARTLAREYRRDVGRFLRGEQEHYPSMPLGYFNDEATALVEAFRRRALSERHGSLVAAFPIGLIEAGFANNWRGSAIGVYANWIDFLKERKADRRALIPVQRRRAAWHTADTVAAMDGPPAA